MKTLQVQVENGEQYTTLRLSGMIDETSDFGAMVVPPGKAVTIDVGGVQGINSYGSREWVKWVQSVDSKSTLRFANCTSIFLDYVNMIGGFVPANGSIESFTIPYYCEACEDITFKFYATKNIKDVSSDISTTVPCAKCHSAAEIDVVMPVFFKFLKRK